MGVEFTESEWVDESGETWTRESFLNKLEWEGGLADLVSYGGAGIFPPSLRELARATEILMRVLDAAED